MGCSLKNGKSLKKNPVHTFGNRNDVTEYHLISLHNHFAKIFESLVKEELFFQV